MLALENTGRGFFLLPPVVGSRLSIDAGCDADLPGAPPWLPPGSSPHPRWWAYSPPATCLRWVRRCGRGARSAPCSWPPRMPMAGAPTDLVVDAPPRTPCACSPLHPKTGLARSAAPGRGTSLRCTTYAVPVPASSARSRHMPHRSPGFKHPLTNASPSLKRTRTASCASHSDGASQSSWPPALGGGRHRGGSPTWSGPSEAAPMKQHRATNATTYRSVTGLPPPVGRR